MKILGVEVLPDGLPNPADFATDTMDRIKAISGATTKALWGSKTKAVTLENLGVTEAMEDYTLHFWTNRGSQDRPDIAEYKIDFSRSGRRIDIESATVRAIDAGGNMRKTDLSIANVPDLLRLRREIGVAPLGVAFGKDINIPRTAFGLMPAELAAIRPALTHAIQFAITN